MRRFFFILITLSILLSINLIIAPSQVNLNTDAGLDIDYPKFETIKFGNDFNLSIDVYNRTNGFPETSASCNLFVDNKTGNEILNTNIPYYSPPSTYRTFLTLNTAQIGEYAYHITCNTTETGGFAAGNFIITGNGEPQPDSSFLIFVYILFLLTCILLVSTLVLTLVKMAMANETIYGVLISWSSYILLIFSNYLGHNYILAPFVRDITDNLILAFGFTNVIIPLISLIITMFIKSTQKKKLVGVDELTGRGLMKYG